MQYYTKTYDLSKDFRFESAHRLVEGYVGKCNNLHGHSWNGTITIRCKSLDAQGMGIDYAVVKSLITKKIEDMFDHKTVLHKNDPLVEKIRGVGSEVVTINDNPTSEVLASFIFNFAKRAIKESGLEGNCSVLKVTIRETCTSACEVTETESHGV